ncbi:hypothetical protein SDC9_185165 [bioreactor metagenome]|uniref:Uncharacterized protein n=1 Tax=bioreactor metagenome TaxID=1076179 RepID=A0A645HF36_9ZZZZ
MVAFRDLSRVGDEGHFPQNPRRALKHLASDHGVLLDDVELGGRQLSGL